MDRMTIRAYLWQDIIRLGFCPTSQDQVRWLREYGRSLKDFWEIDSYPLALSRKNGNIVSQVDCGRLAVCLDCNIGSRTKFNVRFLYFPHPNTKELMWTHDVDGSFFTFPTQLFLTYHNKRSLAVNNFCDEDINAVVDGLLLHPAAHVHIESPIDDHEIRVGGGIDNPFQLLFQLRYQLCPDKTKRRAERNRLAALFAEAIRDDSQIAANKLMAQP